MLWLSCRLDKCDDMLYLPVALQELTLKGVPGQLPSGVSRLSSLHTLDISDNSVRQLPGWLCTLRCLEALNLDGLTAFFEQEVLAEMPGLRRVWVMRTTPRCGVSIVLCTWVEGQEVREQHTKSAATVYGKAVHLHFGDYNRWQHL